MIHSVCRYDSVMAGLARLKPCRATHASLSTPGPGGLKEPVKIGLVELPLHLSDTKGRAAPTSTLLIL